MLIKKYVFLCFLLLPAASFAAEWRTSLTPYLWLPDIDGTLTIDYPLVGDGVSASPDGYLKALDMGFMMTGETRNDHWSVIGDFIYLDFSTSKSALEVGNTPTKLGLKGLLVNLAGGYTVVKSSSHLMDVIFGGRFFNAEVTAKRKGSGPGFNVKKEENIADAIVGIHGKYTLSDEWSLPYHLDLGAGDSDFTWQAAVSGSYAFNWGELTGGYRHLEYDQGNGGLLKDFTFSGPYLGATFSF